MTAVFCFVGGLMLGGTVATVFLCCFQRSRMNEYEEEIRRLRK